jgi:hypothetical protein
LSRRLLVIVNVLNDEIVAELRRQSVLLDRPVDEVAEAILSGCLLRVDL